MEHLSVTEIPPLVVNSDSLVNIKLDRPIAFIDVETMALSATLDRVVEIAVLKINPDGSEDLKSAHINPRCRYPRLQ